MLIAEIRHKLLDLEDLVETADDPIAQVRTLLDASKEDLLTADVFGAIKYLPRIPYLTAVLRAISERNGSARRFQEHLNPLASCAEQCIFSFWPSYRNPAGMPGELTEPDVELVAPSSLIFFEAKLFSGFGSFQIERQLLIGLEHAKGREFFLVLVTAGRRPPRLRISGKRLAVPDYLQQVAAAGALRKEYCDRVHDNADRVLWISWQALFCALERAHKQHCDETGGVGEGVRCAADLLADLRTLLEMRQLHPFRGIRATASTVTTSRPVFFPAAPVRWHAFRGITSATLRGLSYVKPLGRSISPHEGAWRPRGPAGAIRSIVATYHPGPLPPHWLATPEVRGSAQLIAGVGAKYECEILPKGWLAFPTLSLAQGSHPQTHAPRLVKSAVEKHNPQRLPQIWPARNRRSSHRKDRRICCFSRVVSGANLPEGPFRLLKKEKRS